MRVAVCGAGGFVGRYLVRALAGRGDEVIALSSRQGLFDPRSGSLVGALPRTEGLDALIYLSQSPHVRDVPARADHVWSVNVAAALTVAEWAHRAGAKRLIYTSTGNVYRPSFEAHRETDPVRRDDWYALSKVHAEEALRLLVVPRATILRLFGVYGPGQRGRLIPNLIQSVFRGAPVRLQPHPLKASDADGLRLGLTYIDDVTRILLRALEDDMPPIMNAASEEVLNVKDMCDQIARCLNRPPLFDRVPTPRTFDLVPDATLCRLAVPGPYTTFSEGIVATVEEWLDVESGEGLSAPELT